MISIRAQTPSARAATSWRPGLSAGSLSRSPEEMTSGLDGAGLKLHPPGYDQATRDSDLTLGDFEERPPRTIRRGSDQPRACGHRAQRSDLA
jgi:hypothetical protein